MEHEDGEAQGLDERPETEQATSTLVSCFWCERLHPGEHALSVCSACAARYSTMRALEMRGVDFEQVTAGKHKRTVTMFGKNTDEDRAKLKEDLEDVHTLFKGMVSEQRPSLDVERVATGEHWYGTRALELGLIDEIIPRYRSSYFSHIFAGGYSAGYYSYLWSEVLDADAFQAFKETSLFDKETASRFRRLLSLGGSRPGMELYRDFRGRDPEIEPLLKRRGLDGK